MHWLLGVVLLHPMVAVLAGENPPGHGVSEGLYGGDEVPMASTAFQNFIVQQMDEWHVPGVAMAIIDGNKTWSKGFGYATLGSDPVTPSTLFYSGSMTKSVTAAGLSLLVDDARGNNSNSRLSWESRLSDLLGEDFVLSEPWATDHITVEDALCHRTGYPRHDYSGPFGSSSVELVRALRNLPMSKEPRVQWQYNNMMYGVLGYLIERLSRTALADFFRDRLWHPMGMYSTYLHPADALAAGKPLARPYYYNNDTREFGVLPWNDESSVAGAGMAISSVLDWSRYLRHMIEETGPISRAGHAALKAPHMVSEQDLRIYYRRIYSGTESYGLGWGSSMIENEPVWYHSGRVSGMLSYMAFVPGRRFGFVVFMNTESVAALDSIFSATLFTYFRVSRIGKTDIQTGWLDLLKDIDDNLRNCSARLYPSLMGLDSRVPEPLEEYVGSYYNAGYGFAKIELQCNNSMRARGSPAQPSVTSSGCELVIRRAELFGKRVSFHLQHVSGEDWLAWLFVDDYATLKRPTGCYRARMGLKPGGVVELLGLDIRMEGDERSLIWFRRV